MAGTSAPAPAPARPAAARPVTESTRRTHRAATALRGHAASLSWRFRALLDGADTWVTTRAWLRGSTGLLRPDLCVLSGQPPLDGVATSADLAVVWQPLSAPAPALLRAGAAEVWTVLAEQVVVHRAPADHARPRRWATVDPSRTAGVDEELRLPGSDHVVTVAELLLPRMTPDPPPGAPAS